MKKIFKIAGVCVILLAGFFALAQLARADITTGLVAYYTFDEGSGTTAHDTAGTNNGTLSGSTIPTWTTGHIGSGALAFNGSTAYVSVPDASALNPTAITISAWVKFNSFTNAYNAIVQKGNGSVYVEYFVTSTGKMAEYMIASGGGISYDGTGSQTLSTGVWYNVVMTYSSSQGLIGYVNGVQDATVAANGTLSATTGNVLSIGADQFTTGRYSNATIDDVRIYNRALTSSDVTQLYNFTGLPGTHSHFTVTNGAKVSLNEVPGTAGAGWYNASWPDRVSITVAHGKVGATLTNYPVYVDLSLLPAGFFSAVTSSGGDIRVTQSDGVTEVAREIVTINTGSKTGEIFFNAPTLSSSVDTTFYIYYGNAGASDYAANATFGSQNTWNSNYRAVYHLNQAVNNTASGYKDSTVNAFNGTGSNMSGAAVTGEMSATAASFNGTNGRINTGQVLNTSNWSMSVWVNLNAYNAGSSSGEPFYYQGSGAADLGTELLFGNDYPTAGDKRMFGRSGTGGTISYSNVIAPALSSWHEYAASINGTVATYYYDGAAAGNTQPVSGGSVQVNNGAIGGWYDYTDATRYMNGAMQEIRITNSVLASTWVSTEYNNESSDSTFITVGSQTANTGAPGQGAKFYIN